MEQVLKRRFQRYLDGDEKFGTLPDLMLIDGGENHVKIARRVLDDFGLDIPAFGMVKDDKHRTRAIARDGGEIAINSSRQAFTLVSQIQDEVHRFAIEYNASWAAKRCAAPHWIKSRAWAISAEPTCSSTSAALRISSRRPSRSWQGFCRGMPRRAFTNFFIRIHK